MNTNVHTRAAALVLAVLALAACGGGGDGDGAPPDGSTDGTTAVTTVDRPSLVEGIDELALVAPGEEPVPAAPQFEWEAVPGAASYRLVVLGPAGPIWAWEGAGTTIGLGGLSGDRPEGFGGPIVVDGSLWSVAALDSTGTVVAVSEARPLTPA